MNQDRHEAMDRPTPEGPVEPTWAAPAPPSALTQSSLSAESSPFSREGSETPPQPPLAPAPATAVPPHPTAEPAPTPYGVNPYAPPPNPYPPNPYPGQPAPYGAYAPYGYAPVQNQKALLALIFGITGFVLVLTIVGGFVGIAGMVLGRMGRREIDADPPRYTGRSMATAGFWLGLLGVVGSVLYILLFVGLALYGSDF